MIKKVLIAPRINTHDILPTLVVDTRLVNYLLQAGFLPILLPLNQDLETNTKVTKAIFELIPEIAGVIIQGGKDDIDPSLYSNTKPKSNLIRDMFELELVDQCLNQNKSILGICRGMQMINVALGGSLIADLGEKNKTHLSTHNNVIDYTKFELENLNPGLAHEISLLEGSKLHQILDKKFQVNSVHHQAIDKLGQGLFIDAVASDGVVEIISHKLQNILGVQFHPEFDLDNHNFRTIVNYWLASLE